MNNNLAENMIMSLKMVYSVEIMEYFPPERARYFLDLVDSIPNDILATTNPKKALKAGAKLSSFLANINIELKDVGMNIEPIREKLEENNKQMAKALGVPEFILKKR